MKHTTILAVIAAMAIGGCKPETKPTADTRREIAPMSTANVYVFDSVIAYMRQVKTTQQDTSSQLFLKGLDLLKNKKDAAGSVALFEQSLRFYPNDKAYYELGNALLTMDKDSLAYNAFDLAEKLDYHPLGYVLFKKACAIAGTCADDDWDKQQIALDYVKNAIENGFVDREKMFSEPKLEVLRKNANLASIYNEAMSGNGDPATVLWDGYSTSFKQCAFPLTIDMNGLKSIVQPMAISYDYEKYVTEMRDYKFSRDVGNEFFYYAKVASTPQYETLIYGSRGFDEPENVPYSPMKFYLVSYDKKGKLIDKVNLAGQETYDEPFKVATLQQNLNFEIKEYRNTWAKPTGDNGYANNTITKSDLMKTTKFKIDEKGKFVGDAQVLGMLEGNGKVVVE